MTYATPQDMINRYPNRDLVQLTNEDPTATTINTAPITQALGDASAEIDGYIEGRFTLPLSDPPAILNRLATDIAMYRMQSLRPLHDSRTPANATTTQSRCSKKLPPASSLSASPPTARNLLSQARSKPPKDRNAFSIATS